MNNATQQMVMDFIGDTGAWMLFGAAVLLLFAMTMLVIAALLSAARAAWRFLRDATWRDVIILVERRALQ